MKKLISMFLIMAVLLSFGAGCKKEAPEETPQTLDPLGEISNEEMFGHIDQTKPVDGVYKVWNVDGLRAIADHPDGKIELLCNIDLEGAVLEPIPEFTGDLYGANYVISNFTLAGEGENFAFIGVNKGKLHNLLLENVTFRPGPGVKAAGTLVAKNEGSVTRCTIGGVMEVADCAQDADLGGLVAVNTGELVNSITNVFLYITAPQSARVGALVGTFQGGTVEELTANGDLVVEGEGKTAGLFAGKASDLSCKELAFVGAQNSLNGKLITQYFGAESNVTYERMLVRDNDLPPLTEDQIALRTRVVEEMYKMGTVRWHVTESYDHTCTCTANQCHGVFEPEITQIGLPYNHKNGSMNRFLYCMDPREDGSYQFKDWVYDTESYDGHDLYIGNDCSTAVIQAWLTVSNSVDFIRSSYSVPSMGMGTLPVGQWEYDLGLDMTNVANARTTLYLDHNGEDVMYEAYSQLRFGDGVGTYWENGGHNRMVSQDAVTVRDENGKIDPDYSYVCFHEQGPSEMNELEKTYTTWRIDFKYSFSNLFHTYYIPITIEELVTGQMEEPECFLEGGVEDSRLGLTIGTVKANYGLDAVTMVITDEKGDEVFAHTMFPTVTKRWDDGSNDTLIRRVVMEYDLNGFTAPLQNVVFETGKEYRAVITGELTTYDSIVVKDFTFQG